MSIDQGNVARWAPGAVSVAVAGFLAVAFLGFENKTLTKLAELDTKVTVMAENISELRSRDYVTTNQMTTYVDLAILRAREKK